MGTKLLGLALLLLCALGLAAKTSKKAIANESYDERDFVEQEEVLYSEDKPCARDCICTVNQSYRTAKCNRLEVGTQKFGDDITDLVIENADPRFPIQLDDLIFKKLGLHMVATIKIANSTIGSISPKAFHGLHELYSVELTDNKLNYLHPETFANNKKLWMLTLAHNPLKFPSLDSTDYFLNASSVQELDISYCNIKYLAPNIFHEMTDLTYLNVAGNLLNDMNPDAFKNLLDLEEIDLSDNYIKTLPDDIFSANKELSTLHIQRNPIDTVYDLQIPDLLTLNAGQTLIKFVGPFTFNGMAAVTNLNLSDNGMKKIHNQAFHKLRDLNYLDLSYNNLDFISDILIKENIELDIFKISNNPNLTHLPEHGFESAADQFSIYLFDASNCGLEEIYDDSLSSFVDLTQINLSGNKIREISVKVFSKSPKLVDINLAYNFLTALDSKVFENNKDLGKLNLQGNPLKVLPAGVFTHTTMLTWLDLSHTELTSLWQGNNTLSNLNFLNISHCRITEIKQNEIEDLNKLRTLDLTNNPLACNREFENLVSWLSKRNVSPRAIQVSIANLVEDNSADVDTEYKWEALSRKTCGTLPHLVDPLHKTLPHPVEAMPPVSEEEIWETKDSEGDFDLKATLADENTIDSQDDNALNDINYEEEDDEEEDEDDDAYDQDDVQLNVKLVEKEETTTYNDIADDTLPLKEEQDDVAYELYKTYHHDYDIWTMVVVVLGAILILLVVVRLMVWLCTRKSKQVHYNSAIIAAMGQQGRTKKDCGLVYQQLSEEVGPTTPKLPRYQPLQSVAVSATNVSYESSPFHHNNIVPEAV